MENETKYILKGLGITVFFVILAVIGSVELFTRNPIVGATIIVAVFIIWVYGTERLSP